MKWVYDDGGRAAAGYQGKTGDCVIRAIAIAAKLPYDGVYQAMNTLREEMGKKGSNRDGVPPAVTRRFMELLGWEWVPTMRIGSGCKVHLNANELPPGRIICRVSRHVCAVIDGVIHDTHDPQRIPFDGITEEDKEDIHGTRCVYGYWKEKL
jgi:hypothetical protein